MMLGMKVPFGKYKDSDVSVLRSGYATWIWENCRIKIHHYPQFEKWLIHQFGFRNEWTESDQAEYLKIYDNAEYLRLESLKTYVYIVMDNYSDKIVDVYLDYDLMMKEAAWFRESKEGYIRTGWSINKREVKKGIC